jgi:hypothetical protein
MEAKNRVSFYAGKQVDIFAGKGNDVLTKTSNVIDNQSGVLTI